MPFVWLLLCVIINSSGAVILKNSNDSDRKLFKLSNNIYKDFFLLLKEKTLYHCNRATIAIAIICILYYTYSKQSNLF